MSTANNLDVYETWSAASVVGYTKANVCAPGFHDFRQGAGTLYESLLYCSHCGDIFRLALPADEEVHP